MKSVRHFIEMSTFENRVLLINSKKQKLRLLEAGEAMSQTGAAQTYGYRRSSGVMIEGPECA